MASGVFACGHLQQPLDAEAPILVVELEAPQGLPAILL
jgi:hypothetical protein